MKKIIILLFSCSILLSPMFVSAAWYNPFSWFNHQPATTSTPVIENKSIQGETLIPKNETKEVPVEKIIYKDNPEQTQKIAELENELKNTQTALDNAKTLLQNSINTSYSSCKDSLSSLNDKYTQTIKETEDNDLAAAKTVIEQMADSCKSTISQRVVSGKQLLMVSEITL